MWKKIFILFSIIQLSVLPGEEVARKVQFPVMGTVAAFDFTGEAEDMPELFAAGKSCFEKVTAIANLHKVDSELSRLNATADQKPFICSPELYRLLQDARRAWIDSNGAFDISAKPLMDLWGFYRKHRRSLPQAEDIAGVLRKVGLEKVKFNDELRSVYFTVKGMQLDLGGIAKGYAVDRAAESVQKKLSRGIIDLGGNLRLFDHSCRSRRVGIRDPLDGGRLAGVITVGNGAVSTSGGYEKFVTYNNKRYCHIIDPASGLPAEKFLSVTAVTANAVDADWMSTAVFVRGSVLAQNLIKNYPGTEFYIYKESEKLPGWVLIHVKQPYF